MKKRIIWLIIALLASIVGIQLVQSNTQTNPAPPTKREIRYWVAPMDPAYRQDKPGKSPMGMDLVPVYAKLQPSDEGIVKISASVENNLGVKTARVKQGDMRRHIDTVGYVRADENNIKHIHLYTSGWIRKLTVKTTGATIKKGALLLELYSPRVINAEQEFIMTLNNDSRSLIAAAAQRLLTLGVPQSQVDELRKTRHVFQLMKLYATRSGIISKLNVREGMFVKPDHTLMTIEDLSQIWIIADVFERQASWVKVGQPAIAILPYIKNKTWQGKVDYIYPRLDAKTHALRVRLTFPNPDLSMKPNMYATVKILSEKVKQVLSIPLAALIQTGQGDRVIMALGNGRYRAQVVRVGIESEQRIAILSGLKLGDRVVTSAQFLIDSESNLNASFNRLSTQPSRTNDNTSMPPKQFIGMGNIHAMDRKKQTVTLYHQVMPALNMPMMTMTFPVKPSIDLSTIKVGNQIHFVLVKHSDNDYLIIKLTVMH